MRFIFVFGLGVFLGLGSCQFTDKPLDTEFVTDNDFVEDVPDSDFMRYVGSLQSIKLPFVHTTEEDSRFSKFPKISGQYDKVLFEQFKCEGAVRPLGVLFKSASLVGILDLAEAEWDFIPVLTVYDLYGKVVDQSYIYEVTGDDMGYSAREYLTIEADTQFTVVDSIKKWRLNADETDVVPGSQEKESRTRVFTITDSGKIKIKEL